MIINTKMKVFCGMTQCSYWDIILCDNLQKAPSTSKLDLNLRKKLVRCYIWSIALCGSETLKLR